MMNKKRTSRIGLLKYALLLPVTVGLILVSNRQTLAEVMSKISVPEVKTGEKIAVHGKITDEKHNPVPGAIIVVKGSTIGRVSDAEGQFTSDAKEGEILCVFYVGKEM